MPADLRIRGGTLVITDEGNVQADILIAEGRIVEIGQDLPAARTEVVADGLVVMPALIDVHVHFNEPGRSQWEGAATGSRALAAGGGALFFDMPLNSTPCTVTAAAFEQKRLALAASSIADFALWGGLVPGHVHDMAALADGGAIGFKAFMCNSGLPEFPRADDETLFAGMQEAARLRLPVAVHAESEEIVHMRAARMNGRTARDFLDSRPVRAEVDAIQRVTLFAEETGAALHIVHVSSGRGVAAAAAARARGVDVTIETCPHYLYFTEDDLDRLGPIAKCAPPLRPSSDRDALWQALADGRIDIVSSDHSPAEPAMKSGDLIAAWGGIAGVQSTLAVLLDRALAGHGPTWQRIAALVAATPAHRFRLAGKGSLAPGHDADLVLIDPAASTTLEAAHLQQRHPLTPYLGRTFRGAVRRTIRRGDTIFADGRITASSLGRLITPDRHGIAR